MMRSTGIVACLGIVVAVSGATAAETETVAILAQKGIRHRRRNHQPGGAGLVLAKEGSAIRMLRCRNADIAGRDNSILQARSMIQ